MNHRKLCGNCAFPQNFHTRELGEITVFFVVKDHSRKQQRRRNQQVGKEKIIMYVENLHKNMTESDLVELFNLRTTNYLIDNCSFEIEDTVHLF